MSKITYERASKLLNYDEQSGELTWKISHGSLKEGKNSGTVNNGYRRIIIDGKGYEAHRIAWLLFHKRLPKHEIDHINHNKLDNRISNLREVTHAENQRNRSMQSNNTSGHIGVVWDKKRNKWQAQIMVNKSNIFLGLFKDMDEAISVRKKAERQYGFHKNHGTKKEAMAETK